MKVRTRIAPSPTGFAHIGTIYQVLFDYAFAKKHSGQFVVRIEDTDRQRLVEGAEELVMKALSWFGLEEDESPRKGGPYGSYKQSERLAIYKEYVHQLIDKGHAFYCFCSRERLEQMRADQEASKQAPMYDGFCANLTKSEVEQRLAIGEECVVRMRVPKGEVIKVNDDLLGEVKFESSTVDMQVLMKGDGFPTYHLAVVVDDHLMEITHIFRGREWLPSTPKHVLLYQYFGWKLPHFVHLPVILNAVGPGKLSKRHGHASVQYYIDQGYLPEAILNYLSLIVWKHPEGKEIYSLREFIDLFEIKAITSQGPKFDLAKLSWINGQWIRQMSDTEIIARIADGKYSGCAVEKIAAYLPLVKDRLTKLVEFDDLIRFFLVEDVCDVVKADQSEVQNADARLSEMMRGKNLMNEDVVKILKHTLEYLLSNQDRWDLEFEGHLRDWFAGENYRNADAFMTLRVALTGRTATPPLVEIMQKLGIDICVNRLRVAVDRLISNHF